jgi:hypothetical protein
MGNFCSYVICGHRPKVNRDTNDDIWFPNSSNKDINKITQEYMDALGLPVIPSIKKTECQDIPKKDILPAPVDVVNDDINVDNDDFVLVQ